MKIAVVCDVLGEENNGTTIAAMNLIRHLRKKGHEVRIVCPDKDCEGREGYFVVPTLNIGPLNGYVRKNGVSIARAKKSVLEKAFDGIDCIHIMIPFALAHSASVYARKHSIPVTAGFHCQAENFTSHVFLMNRKGANKAAYRLMYILVYKNVDVIHYPTQFIRDVFEAEVGKTEGRVISNGVNDIFRKKDSVRPAHLRDKFIILSTGRYSKEKAHSILIEAVARSEYNDRIQLVFAGEGPQRQKLIELSRKKLSNMPIMKFFSRDALADVINYADLYVHPAEAEIEAIACLEAISCGLVPVIADSPRSATRAFALSRDNLFCHGDPDSLAEKIKFWIENPDRKEQCSRDYLGYTRRFEQESCMEETAKLIIDNYKRKKYGT